MKVAYGLWATLAIAGAVAISGFTPEAITRLLTVGFLGLQALVRPPRFGAPRLRFVALGMALAAVVEGFHMISKPCFESLRLMFATAPLRAYALDLAYTMPAYALIFSLMFGFAARYRWGFWQWTLTMGLGQTLGDGGLLFFAFSPLMLVFLPYPMTNYHAVNVLPYLAVRDELAPSQPATGWTAAGAILSLFATYFLCGALIQLVGRHFGLA